MTIGTHLTLQSAAKAYLTSYEPLMNWIKTELWSGSAKNAENIDKLNVIHDKLRDFARGNALQLNAADFTEVQALFDTAAYDSERSRCTPFGKLPQQTPVREFILQAKNDLLNEVVSGSFVAVTNAGAVTFANRKLRDTVSAFNTSHDALLENVNNVLSQNGLSSFSDQYLSTFRRALKALASSNSQPFTAQMAQILEDGHNVLRLTALALDHIPDTPVHGGLIMALEKASVNYKDTVKPAIEDIRTHHGGLVKQFGGNGRVNP
jgi:hypothetical protein